MRICVCGGGECLRSILQAEKGAAGYFDLALVWGEVPEGLDCETMLLWEGSVPQGTLRAKRVISCGFSPRCSLTLSSISTRGAILSVQRTILCPDGRCVLPQDIPLPQAWAALPAEEQLMLAGAALLMGEWLGKR